MREWTDRANAAGSMSLMQLGGDFGSAAHLQRWLLDCAYPRWWSDGVDRTHGGFHERLQQNAAPTAEPRRARLHPRQMYAFSCADDLGHDGLTEPAVRHGLDYFLRHYVRDDGFIRACVAPEGRVLDDAAILYDQAFALLGFAAAFDVLTDELLRDRARGLLANIQRRMTNPAGGFFESAEHATLLTSNAHMHLFEAALAWMAVDHDPRWRVLAERIVELALARFADPDTRQIREFFTPDWSVAPGEAGRIVEPGHQFEWAWLLLRWHASTRDQRAADLALTLIHQAETRGVDVKRGVAMNSLLVDGTVRDARARLWPQTERLKAACIAWETTRLADYCSMAQRAATTLTGYLATPTPGLWYDTVDLAGAYIDEPAPASSFYHIVAAITELSGTVNRISGRRASVHPDASGQPVAASDRLPRSPR
jgi:mannose/cellobiose epimerase-like protein (N-acyl-D-glucosamine 2-epimerase family)